MSRTPRPRAARRELGSELRDLVARQRRRRARSSPPGRSRRRAGSCGPRPSVPCAAVWYGRRAASPPANAGEQLQVGRAGRAATRACIAGSTRSSRTVCAGPRIVEQPLRAPARRWSRGAGPSRSRSTSGTARRIAGCRLDQERLQLVAAPGRARPGPGAARSASSPLRSISAVITAPRSRSVSSGPGSAASARSSGPAPSTSSAASVRLARSASGSERRLAAGELGDRRRGAADRPRRARRRRTPGARAPSAPSSRVSSGRVAQRRAAGARGASPPVASAASAGKPAQVLADRFVEDPQRLVERDVDAGAAARDRRALARSPARSGCRDAGRRRRCPRTGCAGAARPAASAWTTTSSLTSSSTRASSPIRSTSPISPALTPAMRMSRSIEPSPLTLSNSAQIVCSGRANGFGFVTATTSADHRQRRSSRSRSMRAASQHGCECSSVSPGSG